jgi:PAT family beta-lactamase induction signal transducer AmpG
MNFRLSTYLQLFRNRRTAVMILMGFSSGLPLALTSGTLQAWMAVAKVDLHTIGLFALAGLPYTLKFLWSPLMDRFVPPWLGRRRGWIIAAQLLLIGGITVMAFGSPKNAPWTMGALALMVAFTSASQDIVVDAYRTDILHEVERGVGVAVFVTGYRIAMLVSGALAFILSDMIGWRSTYLLMASLMTIGIAATLLGPEPDMNAAPPRTLGEAVWGPLKDFFSRRAAFAILLLIVLYKLGDAYAGTMTTAFLIRGLGFSAREVGTVNKGLGLISWIVGATAGGTLMVRMGLFRSLLLFGIFQAVSILAFTLLAWTGKSSPVMIFAVALENLTSGMGTAAFLSFVMALCNHRYSATQYALLSSLAALGRVFITPSSGYVVESIGWGSFFVVASMTALPGLLLLWWLRADITGLKEAAG